MNVDVPSCARRIAPRPLTEREHGVVRRLLRSPEAPRALHVQSQHATVVEVCNCGCATVGFAVPVDAPIAGHADDFVLDGWAGTLDGPDIDIGLHVRHGRLHLLEVWRSGEAVDVLPDPRMVHLR